ncbi:MAG TPA: hypothetical protein VJ970_04945 [Flavobacteriaceae bacterium]|nr:hypothetical protein [Flavobacteriaceae bacterium]
MKKLFLSVLALSLVVTTSCDVDQKKEAKLPEVDVDVDLDGEEGQLPKFDVNWADVNVGTTTKTVKVPKVVVVMEEVEVEVPYVDVDLPNEYGEKEERTVVVEAEVEGVEHELDIEKIYANKNNLVVVSTLEKGETTLGDKKIRISDQVTLNAPDLNVRHYIVGERPSRMFNRSYRYFSTMDEVEQKLKGYTVIYD